MRKLDVRRLVNMLQIKVETFLYCRETLKIFNEEDRDVAYYEIRCLGKKTLCHIHTVNQKINAAK